MHARGRLAACCRFEVMPLWEVDAATVMSQMLVGLYPLLPLMRWRERKPRDVLEQSQQLILEEGRQEGLDEGEQKGRQEGLCADVLAVLEVRCGSLPSFLAQQVGQVRDCDRLEALHRRAVVVESPEVFAQELR